MAQWEVQIRHGNLEAAHGILVSHGILGITTYTGPGTGNVATLSALLEANSADHAVELVRGLLPAGVGYDLEATPAKRRRASAEDGPVAGDPNLWVVEEADGWPQEWVWSTPSGRHLYYFKIVAVGSDGGIPMYRFRRTLEPQP